MSEFHLRRVGSIVDKKWQLERLLGVGGMAAVYVAVNSIGHRAAIKILHPEVASDADLVERFAAEGRAVNRFKHPGAIEILDIGKTDDGLPFLVMELLEGSSLQGLLDQGHLPSLDALLRLTDELLDVLAEAHAAGLVHRDIKPDNLFVLPSGRLKVLDFGIARVRSGGDPTRAPTRTGTIIGTASFMAPEQIMGLSDLDGRADVFSVGATLFRVLAGRNVHLADAQFELLIRASSEPAPPLLSVAPRVTPEVALVVDRALCFERERRYPDARTMQGDVRALLGQKAPPFASAMASSASQPSLPAAVQPSAIATSVHAVVAPPGAALAGAALAGAAPGAALAGVGSFEPTGAVSASSAMLAVSPAPPAVVIPLAPEKTRRRGPAGAPLIAAGVVAMLVLTVGTCTALRGLRGDTADAAPAPAGSAPAQASSSASAAPTATATAPSTAPTGTSPTTSFTPPATGTIRALPVSLGTVMPGTVTPGADKGKDKGQKKGKGKKN